MKKPLLLFLAIITGFLSTTQAQTWQWAKQSIGDGHDYGYDIDTDSEGNSYVTGTFQPPSVIIGADTLYASTSFNSGFFVAKYDPQGTPLWARTISGVAGMNSTGIRLNATHDEVLVTGYFKSVGAISFGSDTISSVSTMFDVYLAKYDTSGQSMWAVNAGASAWNGQINYDVDLDANGNSYVAGTFEDTTYLKKFDPSGTELWNRRFSGGTFNTFFWSVDVNNAGESVVAGYFSNTSLLFDTLMVPLNSAGFTIILVKSDAQGNVKWVKNDGQMPSLYKPHVALDAQDYIYVTGYFNGSTCVFGSTVLSNQGADDIFLVKYSPAGALQWAQSAGGYHYDQGIGIATDLQSNCYITGLFRAIAAFGTHMLFNNGDPDIFVAKYDGAGNALWAKQAGGSLVDNGNAIAVDDSANCYVTGRFTSPTPTFDNITLQNSSPQFNPYDFFVARLGTDTITGIPEPVVNSSLIVYPNPLVTESELVLAQGIGEHTCELFDMRGSLLRKIEFHGNRTTIQRGLLAPGMYLLRVHSKNSSAEMLLTVID